MHVHVHIHEYLLVLASQIGFRNEWKIFMFFALSFVIVLIYIIDLIGGIRGSLKIGGGGVKRKTEKKRK